jgi:hypothetical protein
MILFCPSFPYQCVEEFNPEILTLHSVCCVRGKNDFWGGGWEARL